MYAVGRILVLIILSRQCNIHMSLLGAIPLNFNILSNVVLFSHINAVKKGQNLKKRTCSRFSSPLLTVVSGCQHVNGRPLSVKELHNFMILLNVCHRT